MNLRTLISFIFQNDKKQMKHEYIKKSTGNIHFVIQYSDFSYNSRGVEINLNFPVFCGSVTVNLNRRELCNEIF